MGCFCFCFCFIITKCGTRKHHLERSHAPRHSDSGDTSKNVYFCKLPGDADAAVCWPRVEGHWHRGRSRWYSFLCSWASLQPAPPAPEWHTRRHFLLHSLAYSTAATRGSLLFCEQALHTRTSGPLYSLFLLPGMFWFLSSHVAHTPFSFFSLSDGISAVTPPRPSPPLGLCLCYFLWCLSSWKIQAII